MSDFTLKLKSTMMKMPMMLTCRDFETFIADYFEGNLSRYARLKFAIHLKMCKSCKSYIDAYRRSKELGKQVFANIDAEVPPEVPEDLVKAVLDAQKQS